MNSEKNILLRERAKTRFYMYSFQTNVYYVSDSLQPPGEKWLGKFNNKKLAELFLRIVRAQYVKKGDLDE